jgi:hypothetical protein
MADTHSTEAVEIISNELAKLDPTDNALYVVADETSVALDGLR